MAEDHDCNGYADHAAVPCPDPSHDLPPLAVERTASELPWIIGGSVSLQWLRVRANLRQVDLAQRVGWGLSKLQQVETGGVERAITSRRALEDVAAFVSALGGQLHLVAVFDDQVVAL